MRITLLSREERYVSGTFEYLKLYLWWFANAGTTPINLLLFVLYGRLDPPVYTYFVYLILLRVIIVYICVLFITNLSSSSSFTSESQCTAAARHLVPTLLSSPLQISCRISSVVGTLDLMGSGRAGL